MVALVAEIFQIATLLEVLFVLSGRVLVAALHHSHRLT
jgi:hypothetical protein